MSETAPAAPDAQPAITSSPEVSPWPAPLRYGVGAILIAICVVSLFLILPLIQIILLSFLIAFIMFLPGGALARRTRLPYGLCVLASFGVAVAVIVVLALMVLPDLVQLFRNINTTLEQAYSQFLAQLEVASQPVNSPPEGIALDVAAISATLHQLLPAGINDTLVNVMQGLFGVFGDLASLTAMVGTASVIALFFLIDLPISGGTVTNWIPPAYQRETILLFDKLDRLWLKFFRALVVIGVVTAAANLAVFLVFGLRAAVLLAIITATIGMIPVVGRLMSIILVFIVALSNGSSTFTNMDNLAFALLIIVAYLIVTQAINSIISPRLKGSAINVPTVAIVLGVMVGLIVAGIPGALLVAPIMGSLRLFMSFAVEKILLHDPYPGEPLPPLQGEGFFSHMLYVKKKEAAAEAEA